MVAILLFSLGLAALAAIAVAARDWSMRRRVLERLYADAAPGAGGGAAESQEASNALALWLVRAGYRRPDAPAVFMAATAGCIALGVAVSQFYRIVLVPTLVERVAAVPGSTGDVLAALLQGGP